MENPVELPRIKRELDEEIGKKILDYVYNKKKIRGKEGGRGEKSKTKTLNLTKSGHKQDYYVYTGNRNHSAGGGLESVKMFVDTTLDSLNIKTSGNIQEIDTYFLKANDITLAILIDEIQVKISDLYAGDVLRKFQDLVYIGFQPKDLVRNRELFNCDMLGNLFKTNYENILANGIRFDMREIVLGGFLASDLKALDYNLDDAIRNGFITLPALKVLNFSLEGLSLIGFRREHLKKLKIGKV